VVELSKRLEELEPLIHSPESVTAGGVSYDDVDLFGKTRGLTVVQGLVLPPRLKAYLDNYSEQTEIPLYYQMQL
jgi:glutaredoxin 2